MEAAEGLYRMQLFKDVPERNGGFKIFRHYDEDPEIVIDEARSAIGEPPRREGA